MEIAALIGGLAGVIFLVTILPAAIGGFFTRVKPPGGTREGVAWGVAILLAYAGVYGGGTWPPAIIALALLAALHWLRLRAWKRRTT